MNINKIKEICEETCLPFEYNGYEIYIKSDLFNQGRDFFFLFEKALNKICVYCVICPGFNNKYETAHDDIISFRYNIKGDEIEITEEKLKYYLQLLKQNYIETLEKRALKQLEKDFE